MSRGEARSGERAEEILVTVKKQGRVSLAEG